ncbi:MAG: signal peptidase II [Alphaproteobacteria bacterium]|nr:signal peptidase II [Alphaproteobacteria bacterium]
MVTPAARTGFALAAVIFVLDQASKWIALGPLALPERTNGLDILPIFRLIYTQNYGVSWGMMTAQSDLQRWVLVGVTLFISIGAAIWLARETSRVEALGLGLIVGGAGGNVLDRVRLGAVTDFLNIHFGGWSPFLVFNVADAAITIGVLILLAWALRTGGKERSGAASRSGDEENA